MKIGIICGGRSAEHEVSILTALDIYKKCPWIKYFYYINRKGILKRIIKPNIKRLVGYNVQFHKGRIGFEKLDSLIIANHGQNGEDGMMPAVLEYYQIPYVGTNMEGSILSFDKDINYKLLDSIVPMVPKKVLDSDLKDIPFEYPFIIKPARAGSSLGIQIVNNVDELKDAYLKALKYDKKIIAEKLLVDFEEVSIAAYKDISIKTSEVEVISKKKDFFSFDEKYYNHHKNEEHSYMENNEVALKIKEYTSLIYQALELSGIVRMDYMVIGNEIYFNEVNNVPGALANYYFNDFNKILKILVEKSRNMDFKFYPKLELKRMTAKK